LKTETDETRALYQRLLAELKAKHPTHLKLLLEPLKRAAAKPKAQRDADMLRGVVAAANEVLAAVDTTELAVYLARKSPEEGPGAAQKKTDMDERKGAVAEALAAKCGALLDLQTAADAAASSPDVGADFEAAFAELRRWVDPAADPTHAVLLSQREAAAGWPALALRALDKVAAPEDKPAAREVLEQRAALFERLGWAHWARTERTRINHAFPPAYPPF